jgi:hypothetical protein
MGRSQCYVALDRLGQITGTHFFIADHQLFGPLLESQVLSGDDGRRLKGLEKFHQVPLVLFGQGQFKEGIVVFHDVL